MYDLAWVGLIWIAAWGIGDVILKCSGVSSARGASALTVGLALFSCLFLILGGLGMMNPQLLRGSVLTLAVLSLVRLWPHLGALPQRLHRPKPLILAFSSLLGTRILLSILAALDAPSMLDLSHYHLRAPIFWLEHGRVSWPFRDVIYHYPQGMEMLYALGLALGSSRVPQLIHLLTALTTLWGVISFARRRWGWDTALLAGLLYWSIPEVYYLTTIAFVDLAWSGAEVLAVLAFVDGLDIPDPRRRLRQWALVGALVGWAAAIKYSALWSILLLGIGIAWASLTMTNESRERSWRALRAGAVYVTFVLALASFWYGKNWLRFGNPVYPFLWGGRGLSPETAEMWTGLLRMFGPSRTLARFLRLPWDISMTQNIPAMRPSAFPYPIALMPALIAYRRRGRAVIVFFVFSLAYLTAWYWTGTQQLRFVLAPMTLACILAAQGASEILHRRQLLTIIVGILIFVALLLGIGLQWQALSPHILSKGYDMSEPGFRQGFYIFG